MWHSPAAEESEKARCSSAASPKLFTFRGAGMQVSLIAMSRPPQTVALPPPLPLGIKDSLKEDLRLFDEGLFLLKGGLLEGDC
jgi:hypothetical protein